LVVYLLSRVDCVWTCGQSCADGTARWPAVISTSNCRSSKPTLTSDLCEVSATHTMLLSSDITLEYPRDFWPRRVVLVI